MSVQASLAKPQPPVDRLRSAPVGIAPWLADDDNRWQDADGIHVPRTRPVFTYGGKLLTPDEHPFYKRSSTLFRKKLCAQQGRRPSRSTGLPLDYRAP